MKSGNKYLTRHKNVLPTLRKRNATVSSEKCSTSDLVYWVASYRVLMLANTWSSLPPKDP